jgi:hypothetical protein
VAGEGDGERTAVLETVRRYFGTPEPPVAELLGGQLLESETLPERPSWDDLYEETRALEFAEVVELGSSRAVVDVRGVWTWTVRQGSHASSSRVDGPAVLEKQDGTWRIVDYVVDGRRRSDSLILGVLAEQQQKGAAVRILMVDRAGTETRFVAELADTGAGHVRIANAYSLVEHDALWSNLGVGTKGEVPEGGRRTILLDTHHVIDLDEKMMAVALDVRSASGRIPFVLTVPPVAPDEVVPQPAPRRLPLLRRSRSWNLLIAAAATVAMAWWAGWVAILVPLYLGLQNYWRIRVNGSLPPRLYPVRRALDVAVVLAAVLIVWWSPVAWLAVPLLVGILVFLAFGRFGTAHQSLRFGTAFTAAFLWLYLLGNETAPLSPCRIAGGSASHVADSFAGAVLTGDVARARALESSDPIVYDERTLFRIYASTTPAAALETRQRLHNHVCRTLQDGDGVVACYAYTAIGSRKAPAPLQIFVSCENRSWRVRSWL